MPIKRKDFKEFAIGTKIKYMNKLYLVVAQTYCDNCSIANICSNNDMTSGNNITGVLSRDKRISIFGECSSIVRSDGKSVAFKEIPKTKEQDVYNVGPLYKTNNELMPIQIDVPKDFVIDIENSDLDKGIVKFKKKDITYDYILQSYATDFGGIRVPNHCIDKILAISKLMNIAKYYNGDWNYDFTKECVGYSIAYYKFVEEPHYSVIEIYNSVYTYYGNPIFKNEADAQYVIDNPNFRNILDKIFKG